MSILVEILKYKQEGLKQTKTRTPLRELKALLKDTGATRPFRPAITRSRNGQIRLIAELKQASPSKGRILENFNASEILSVYDSKQTDAISVLTEEKFFQGGLDYLRLARQKTGKPLLRKDFIFDEYQVYESRVNGADAVLLIAAALDKYRLGGLRGLSKELSMECLVEVHGRKELDFALRSGADIIGINNRNLNTLEVNPATTFELLDDIPDDRVIVSESGISTRDDVKAIESTKTDAILVGTAIIKAGDIGLKIDELLGRKG